MSEIIFQRIAEDHHVSATVYAQWMKKRFIVKFIDNDYGETIETRIYDDEDKAIAFARKLIGDNKP